MDEIVSPLEEKTQGEVTNLAAFLLFKVKWPPPIVTPPDYWNTNEICISQEQGGKSMCLHFIMYENLPFLVTGCHRSLVSPTNLTSFVSPAQKASQLQLEMASAFSSLLKSFLWRSMWSTYNKPNFFIKNVNTDKTICWNVRTLSASQPSKN